MTNFEFYKEKILEIGIDDIAVTEDDEILNCCGLDCSDCIFYHSGKSCEYTFMKWLYEERKKPCPLSDFSYKFLKYAYEHGHKYLTKDKVNGSIFLYSTEPTLSSNGEVWKVGDTPSLVFSVPYFIKSEFVFMDTQNHYLIANLLDAYEKEHPKS